MRFCNKFIAVLCSLSLFAASVPVLASEDADVSSDSETYTVSTSDSARSETSVSSSSESTASSSDDVISSSSEDVQSTSEQTTDESSATDITESTASSSETTETESTTDTISSSSSENTENAADEEEPLDEEEVSVSATYNSYVTSISKESTPNAYNAALMLIENGLSIEAACGIVGNFFCESGGQGSSDINPADDDGNAAGIAQWTGSGRTAFMNYCEAQGRNWQDLDIQIEYFLYNVESRWASAADYGSVSALYANGYTDLLLSYEDFKTTGDVQLAAISFLGVYEDDLYEKTAIWAGFSSLTDWVLYEVSNRVTCAYACYSAFFDGEIDLSIITAFQYVSTDIRKGYTKIDKKYAMAQRSEVEIYEERDEASRVIANVPKGGLVYILADCPEDWVYVESGTARGFVRKSLLNCSAGIISYVSSLGEENLKTADTLIPLWENKAADFTTTTVYYFRAPSNKEIANYASILIGKQKDDDTLFTSSEEYIIRILKFFNYLLPGIETKDLYASLDELGVNSSWENAGRGYIVVYKDASGEKNYGVYTKDGCVMTVSSDGSASYNIELSASSVLKVIHLAGQERINNVPYYSSFDYTDVKYGSKTVSSDGGLICCFSMAASLLTDSSVSPIDVAAYGNENKTYESDVTTALQAFSSTGAVKLISNGYGPKNGGDSSAIIAALENGYVVIGYQIGGHFNPSSTGRYILYTGITDSDRICINDPASRARSYSEAYSSGTAFDNCYAYWIFKI